MCNSSLTNFHLLPQYCAPCIDAVFCVWRPPEDLRQLLKEGCSYRVYSLQASEGRYISTVFCASSDLLEACSVCKLNCTTILHNLLCFSKTMNTHYLCKVQRVASMYILVFFGIDHIVLAAPFPSPCMLPLVTMRSLLATQRRTAGEKCAPL